MEQEMNMNEKRNGNRRPKKNIKKSRINWWLVFKLTLYTIILIFSIWAWNQIVEKGYDISKNYVDTAIEQVRQENAINIQELQSRMSILSSEMSSLREAIESTDESISGSTSVQVNIDERLQQLDNQLQDLEKSLKILREAP